jgi:hypothetical protein
MKELCKSLLVVVVTTALALLSAEAAFRIVSGKKVFALTRYRAANIIYNVFPKNVASYDPLLGWRLNPGVRTPIFNTIDYGIRRNSVADDHVRPGGILVSGASFTLGSEVGDEETWPAQLENLIGQPVVNAAIGGFGADQVIMRAEQMLPIIKPEVLVVDLVQDNIGTAGQSYSGYPKPYFTVENDQLVLRNNPVPRYEPHDDPYESLKNVLSYSLMVDRVMATYFPDAWYSSRTQNFTRANNDEVNVTCLLLLRLKKETDAAGVRLLVTMQYGPGTITTGSQPDGNVRLVEECAERSGIQLLDEFAALKELSQNHADEFRKLYVAQPNGLLGHKSRAGNLAVAKAVAAALALPAPARGSSQPVAEQEVRELGAVGEVVISADEFASCFQSSPHARIEAKGAPAAAGAYRVLAIGKSGEHYVVAHLPGDAGRLTFSLEAHADTSSALKLQVFRGYHDGTHDGVMGNFDMPRDTAAAWRLGVATDIETGISPIRDGWYRLWVTATIPSSDTGQNTAVIQLADHQGSYGFDADGDAVFVRNMKLERTAVPNKHQVKATGSSVQ